MMEKELKENKLVMDFNKISEEELIEFRDTVSVALTALKRSVVKKKLKIFSKSLLSVVLVAGGVATAIIFPSPITLAALGGAAALIGGSKGVVGDIKGVRKKLVKASEGKKNLKTLDYETANRKTTRDITDAVNRQVTLRVLPPSSAPPMYPSLQQYQYQDPEGK